ncbi:hypothetical protein K7X08_023802 [Anisodus acutangulus]|uniref:Uncharacterized protein n=1 Tax=Anisodus acutangulus TaxID=402998 RepID=A0A9Q1QXC4_9SOLA|nr:hypothetical protein K7X08_023802 [Anisodus acutangulus]
MGKLHWVHGNGIVNTSPISNPNTVSREGEGVGVNVVVFPTDIERLEDANIDKGRQLVEAVFLIVPVNRAEHGEEGEIKSISSKQEPSADSITSSQQVKVMFEKVADYVEENMSTVEPKAIEMDPKAGVVVQSQDVQADTSEGKGTEVVEKATKVQENQ